MSIVWLNDGRRAVVGELTPWFSTLTLRLFVAPDELSPLLSAADFTEPSFAGYSWIPLNRWSGNILNPDNQGEVDEELRTFRVSAVSPAQSVQGYWVADQNGYAVWAELHPERPVPMYLPGQSIILKPRVMCGELT